VQSKRAFLAPGHQPNRRPGAAPAATPRLGRSADGAKWSGRATLLFVIGTCGGFWALAAWTMSILSRR